MRNSIVKKYKKNGIIKVKNLINKNDVKKILININLIFLEELKNKKIINNKSNINLLNKPALIQKYKKKFKNEYNNITLRIIQRIPEVYNLGSSKKIISLIKKMGLKNPAFSTDPLIMLNSKYTNNTQGMGYAPLHQDWRTIQGSLNCLVIWIPLTNISKNMGSIFFLQSSHKKGLYKTSKHKWFEAIKLKKKLINEKEEVIGIGDAFIFSSFLVHRSSINKSNKVRISLQFRYNDLSEKTYIQRGFPVNYKHAEPKKKIITKKFPKQKDLEIIFGK